jgi:hypothetical protein
MWEISFKTLFQNKIANNFYDHSITHKDDHFAKKTAFKLDRK